MIRSFQGKTPKIHPTAWVSEAAGSPARPWSDDPQLLADRRERLERVVDLLGGVGGHHAGAQAALRRRHGGWHHRIGEDACVVQLAPEHEGGVERTDEHRNDRRGGGADLDADRVGDRAGCDRVPAALPEPTRAVPAQRRPDRRPAAGANPPCAGIGA